MERTRGLPATTAVILDVPLTSGIVVAQSTVIPHGDVTGPPGMIAWVVLIVGRVDAKGAVLPTAMLHEWPPQDAWDTRDARLGTISQTDPSNWWRQPLVAPVSRPTWFILDSDRQRDVSRSRLDGQLDNRYRYSVDHLPPADTLGYAGITDAILVSAQSMPATDLEPWIGSLLDDGFPVRVRTCP